jgi:hypothetical protein
MCPCGVKEIGKRYYPPCYQKEILFTLYQQPIIEEEINETDE